jgi:hypothetical protein
MNTGNTTKPHRHDSWAWLLAVPPLMAVIGGIITMYFVVKYPDQAIAVDTHTEVSSERRQVHQHVVNSVTPPLK